MFVKPVIACSEYGPKEGVAIAFNIEEVRIPANSECDMQRQYSPTESVVRRKFLMSLVVSLLLLAGGMVWTVHVWKQTNLYFHTLFHVRIAEDSLTKDVAMMGKGKR
jgi:hypothetical protein